MELQATISKERPINPVEIESADISTTDVYLRVALLVAPNKPRPYLIIQIYTEITEEVPTKVLNYALYPDEYFYKLIKVGEITTVDFILSALMLVVSRGDPVFNTGDGVEWVKALNKIQPEFQRLIGSKIDITAKAWAEKQ